MKAVIQFRSALQDLLRQGAALAGLVLLLLTASACDSAAPPGPGEAVVETASGSHRFSVELAVTPEEQARGLMYRDEMDADHGMLFDFGAEREAYFWMRNTYISLDMIFVKADGTIHRIAEHTMPLSDRIVPSNGPVRAVFEVVAGTSRRLQMKPGDKVRHPIFKSE